MCIRDSIPVSICYDEVPEQGSYSREAGGGQKVKESAAGLLESRKIVRRRFGKVYVRLGEPVSARQALENGEKRNEDFTLTLQKSAFKISKTICDVTPITTKSIVSTVVLSSKSNALTYEQLMGYARWLAEYVRIAQMPLSTPDEDSFARSLEQTVRRLIRGSILLVNEGVPRQYQCDPRRRTLLNFYKNNSIHCFVVPSITALSVLSWIRSDAPGKGTQAMHDDIVQRALSLRRQQAAGPRAHRSTPGPWSQCASIVPALESPQLRWEGGQKASANSPPASWRGYASGISWNCMA